MHRANLWLMIAATVAGWSSVVDIYIHPERHLKLADTESVAQFQEELRYD
jgi:hypothetical protein